MFAPQQQQQQRRGGPGEGFGAPQQAGGGYGQQAGLYARAPAHEDESSSNPTSMQMPSFFGSTQAPVPGSTAPPPQERAERGAPAMGMGGSMFSSFSSPAGAARGEAVAGSMLENKHLASNSAASGHGGDDEFSSGGIKDVTLGGRHGGELALAGGEAEADMDMDMLPPANSLLAGLPSRGGHFGRDRGEDLAGPSSAHAHARPDGDADAGVDEGGLRHRRRQAMRKPGPSQGGLDLGAPRGLDLSSPLVLSGSGSGSGGREEDNGVFGEGGRGRGRRGEAGPMGVTAAVQLVHVKSPWVTVFGFPPAAAFAVLRHFQGFGEVHERRGDSGNWMHILYNTKVEASRAIAQNGQLIAVGDIRVMVGVKACSDPSLADVGAALTACADPSAAASSGLAPTGEASSLAAARGLSSASFDQRMKESYRVTRPEQLRQAPQRANTACKRFWAWVLDV